MRITEIAVYEHKIPIKNGPYRMSSTGDLYDLTAVLTKITTDTGHFGWSEVCLLPTTYQHYSAPGAREAIKLMAPALIGADPTQILDLHRRMNSVMIENNFAKSAIDIAAHDVTGKHYGVRVADLLGGPVTEDVPSYYSVGVLDPSEAAEQAAAAVADGFPSLQLKIGGRPVELDIETAHKVWERVGHSGVKIRVDGNRILTARDTLRLSRECQDIPLAIEQPCNTLEEIRGIHGRVNHAIYLDESTKDLATVIDAANSGLAAGFCVKISRVGGLRAMAIVRDICDIYSLPHTTDDSWGGDLFLAACVHAASTVRTELNEGSWGTHPTYLDQHYDLNGGLTVRNGHVRLPDGPGLGVIPDESLFGDPVAVIN